jgi:small-conductance mechanosensitive channel
MVTTLGQVSAIDPRGEAGGGWTGGLTVIANSAIFKQPIVNFTRGYPFVWCSLTYTFTYESDWRQAETLLLEAVDDKEISATAHQAQKAIESMTSDFAIRVRSTEPVVRTRAAGSGIDLMLRFLAHPRHRRLLMDRVNRQILDAVNQADDVNFAYHTIRTIPTPPETEKGVKP